MTKRHANWGYQVTIKGPTPESIIDWYHQALTEQGWKEEQVSHPAVRLLLFSRDGLYLSLVFVEWHGETLVRLHRRDSLRLTEPHAMEVAKALIRNHERGLSWEVRYEEAYMGEHTGQEAPRPTWIIARVYGAGNQEVVFVDALTGEPYRVGTIEGRG